MAVTAATFKTAYPEFEDTGDALVGRYIDEAGLWVNETWGDDEDNGVMYYVAHTLEGIATGTEVSDVVSISSGSHKTVFRDTSTGNERWNGTRYGRLFWLLLQRNTGHRVYAV